MEKKIINGFMAGLLFFLSITCQFLMADENEPVLFQVDTKLELPTGFTALKIAFLKQSDETPLAEVILQEGYLINEQITPEFIEAIITEFEELGIGPDDILKFKWEGENKKSDAQICKIPALPKTKPEDPPNDPPNQPQNRNGSCDDVDTELSEWMGKMLTEHGKSGYILILFNGALDVCNVWPKSYASTGDAIYVGVVVEKTTDNIPIKIAIEPCSLEPVSPAMLITKGFPDLVVEQSGDPKRKPVFTIKKYTPFSCYNSVVNITLTKELTENNKIEGKYILHQYQRYRGTLQLGVLNSEFHEKTFGLREEDEKKVIYDKGPIERGPEYMASLVIYSFPRYLESLFSGIKYSGRDVINDNNFIDRLGLVLGVGLTKPGRRFAVGASFEIVYGLNIVGMYEYVKQKGLAGLEVGDEFTGKEEEIPTYEFWGNSFSIGLSIDLRYITALFQRK